MTHRRNLERYFTQEVINQIELMTGPEFELGRLAAGYLLRLDFVDGQFAAFKTLNNPETESDSPQRYAVLGTTLPEMPLGEVFIHGTTRGGTMIRSGVLTRFSMVNWNMMKKFRPEPGESLDVYKDAYDRGIRLFGQDENGYFVEAIRWPFGMNTPELAQVGVMRPNDISWQSHFPG